MVYMSPLLGTATLFLLAGVPVVHSQSYDNVFIDPSYILTKSYNGTTINAQVSIEGFANQLASQGPWSVVNKTIVPPSGNKHDYMSWAPYSWPNCSSIGNTTVLPPEQVWTTCPYVTRDGQFNPDIGLVPDADAFQNMSDAVLSNALAWQFTDTQEYGDNAAKFVYNWFINPDTAMTPNLNYAQMERGPDGQKGSHTGVLDLKCMTKVVSGLLILRGGNITSWTSEMDGQMTNWTKQYISWLETSPIAIQEAEATNNHGTFYYNQLAALQIFINDKTSAQQTIQKYFTSQFLGQINATGEQPLEAVRTRPYHYRAYNLAAMITNARIGVYLGISPSPWTVKSKEGATIQSALDFTMTLNAGDEDPSELYPDVAAVAAAYGDPTNKYVEFLFSGDTSYYKQPYFLWSQPLSDMGLANGNGGNSSTSTGHPSPSSSSSTSKHEKSGNTGLRAYGTWMVMTATCSTAVSLLFFISLNSF